MFWLYFFFYYEDSELHLHLGFLDSQYQYCVLNLLNDCDSEIRKTAAEKVSCASPIHGKIYSYISFKVNYNILCYKRL